jgi:hypothetical protein
LKSSHDLSFLHTIRSFEFMTAGRSLNEFHQFFFVLAEVTAPLLGFIFVDRRIRNYQKLKSRNLAYPFCSLHESWVLGTKSAAEEELIQVKNLFSDRGQPNIRTVVTAHTPAGNVVRMDRDISKAVFPPTAWAISYNACYQHVESLFSNLTLGSSGWTLTDR